MDKTSFTYTAPLNVNVVEIKGEEHLFVEGDISTTDIDLVNDIMTQKCQKSMQKQILGGNMKLDLEHEAFKGTTHEEKEISKTKIPVGKIIDATVKEVKRDNGIAYVTRVKCEINRNHKDYKSIKGNLVEKYLDAFSVAFLPTEVKYEQVDGKSVRLLDDCVLLNVALTGNPCNTKAQMTDVIAKSLDALELYKKGKETNPELEGNLVVKAMKEFCKEKYPWDQCILDQKKKGYSQERAEKICGAIRAGTAKKSNLTGNPGNSELNLKPNSKMTENTPEGDVNEVEQKELKDLNENLKSISENLKSMNEKMEAVTKENETLKEAVEKNAAELARVVKAMEQPVHKSTGVQIDDAKNKAQTGEMKSVDPLNLV